MAVRHQAAAAEASAAPRSSSCWPGPTPPLYLTPMTRDRAQAAEWLERFEGAGLDGVMVKPDDRRVSARQARDDQGQARANGRLRRGRLPLAQERPGHADRVAAARALRRRGVAAARRRHVVVHDGRAQGAGRGAGAASRAGAWTITRGASGRDASGDDDSACPAARAVGAPARTCRGSRCASSACAK